MNFRRHSECEGLHSFLSASKYHWINYDEARLADSYQKHLATLKGTELHEFAAQCIKLGIKLPKSQKTLNMYVNDAIGFNMRPEQVLYYSENAFGTADAISYRNNFLRIHDLKTGTTKTHIEQLLIYAAYFCLEYRNEIDMDKLQIELRIYQNDDILVCNPTIEDIVPIMDKIITFDKRINQIKREEAGLV